MWVTERQTLAAHLGQFHRRVKVGHKSFEALAREHAHEHHRNGSRTHFHEGVNLGPGHRPEGWRTGTGVVEINKEQR